MVFSHFRIGTAPESHYVKSGKFCTWPSLHILLGSHRSCNPILTYKVIVLSITIPLSHIFDLNFVALKNLFITRANFKDHVIKFSRSQFTERKCQRLNINVNRLILIWLHNSTILLLNIKQPIFQCISINVLNTWKSIVEFCRK